MRRAITIVLVLLAGFAGGFTVGMVLRAEQVTNANSRVERRDEKIKDLEDQLSALRAAAAEKPVVEPPSSSQAEEPEGSTPSPPGWPKGDPDNEIVETGKPKEEDPFKTLPMPNN